MQFPPLDLSSQSNMTSPAKDEEEDPLPLCSAQKMGGRGLSLQLPPLDLSSQSNMTSPAKDEEEAPLPLCSAQKMNTSLTEEQIAEYREAYCLMTKDGEGPVTARKLGRVMRLLGLNPSDRELQDMMTQIDPKGTVDFAEFLKVMTWRSMDAESEEQLREAFRVLDKDGDGYLTVGELRHLMTNLGEKLTEEEVEDMVSQVDSARQGRISCDDFVKIVTS